LPVPVEKKKFEDLGTSKKGDRITVRNDSKKRD